MNPHPDLGKLLNWLLNHSLQAGVLVLLVLAVQWIFRRQLTHRWRFALWWIVLVRLLLPFNPQSAAQRVQLFSTARQRRWAALPGNAGFCSNHDGNGRSATGFPTPVRKSARLPAKIFRISRWSNRRRCKIKHYHIGPSAASQHMPHPVTELR